MTSKNWTIPTINFTHSPELEARRILFVAGSLARGWYQKHNFLILPELAARAPSSQVILPNLPYTTIPRFWESVAKLKLVTPQLAPAPLIAATEALCKPFYKPALYVSHLSELEKSYNQVKDNFWNTLFTLFPSYSSRVKVITIISSQYGSSSSFNLATTEYSSITIYLRSDTKIDKLLWSILAAIFRPKMQDEQKYSWEEVEAVIDWLMSESSLAAKLSHPHPTLTNLRANQLSKYRQDSEAYLSSLGISGVLRLEKLSSSYSYGDTKISDLTTKQQILLDLLLVRRGLTVSYDEIAASLWPDDEDWSLYAITKEVQRLRDKIKSCGINSPLIHAHRKLGYSIA
ncbi:winged helix-turn-helix domain-containing protein [Candidatus Woesebacteria bacterium]|nr:winged helix-turn-helix domain-containing protein [Candidatus Woesebacteria bacterium]